MKSGHIVISKQKNKKLLLVHVPYNEKNLCWSKFPTTKKIYAGSSSLPRKESMLVHKFYCSLEEVETTSVSCSTPERNSSAASSLVPSPLAWRTDIHGPEARMKLRQRYEVEPPQV